MEKNEKRLRYLLGRYPSPAFHLAYGTSHEDWWGSYLENRALDPDPMIGKFQKKLIEHLKEIESLRIEFGMSVKELADLWYSVRWEREQSSSVYKQKPTKEGRDNKGVFVGSGSRHYDQNTVRYPSKKRSKRTWKIFYEMFPYYAKRDGWDGNKSKKCK
jgi:hypothetical protein